MRLFVVAFLAAASFAAIAAPAGRMSRGETLFRENCIGCHSISCNRTGPKLQNVYGRKAGSLTDFGRYTESLKNSGIIWSEQTVSEFIGDPAKLVPGTAMTVTMVKNPKDRQEIVAFVKKQDTSVDLCF